MIYLFLLCLCVNLISANPLAKLLLQTRPNCNQNGYSSYNVPIQANNQPYVSHFTSQNPMTTCSNTQQFGHQNGLPVQIQLDDPNQSYLNKIMSNPMLQNIINRNNNNCNQNCKEIALQPNPEPTHIVNNYYIIPTECLQGKDDGIEIVKKLIGDQTVVCQNDKISNQKHTENERKNMERSHNRQNEEKRRPKSNKRPPNQEHGNVTNQNNNNPQKRKRKNGHQNQNRGNQSKNSQNMNKNVHNKNHEPVKIIDERNLPRKLNGTQVSQPQKNGKKRRQRPHKKSEDENINNVEQTSNDTISSKNDTVLNDKEGKPRQKIRRKYKEISESNKDEEVIRDIHKKFPGIPEDVIRRLLRYLRRQLQKSCESVQPSDSKIKSNQNHKPKSDNKRHRNKQRNQIKRGKSKNNTDLVEVTESSLTITTDHSLFTSTQPATTNGFFNNPVDDSKTHNNGNEYTTQHKIEAEVVETTTNTNTQIPKLGEEDKILDLENNVDDYFPDFRFDKMYMSEDDYIRSLRDNRFYYTTDRNYNSENENNNEESSEIYYEPYETTKSKKDNNYEFQSREIEDTLLRPDKDNFDKDDEVAPEDYSREELEFQTPPILEYPDFETKPIIKYYDVEGPIYKQENKKVDNTNDKLSTYSDVKSYTTPLKDKPKSDNIETVFAKSKVAKYGQPDEIEEDTMIRNDNSKSDDTVLVFAKSFPDT